MQGSHRYRNVLSIMKKDKHILREILIFYVCRMRILAVTVDWKAKFIGFYLHACKILRTFNSVIFIYIRLTLFVCEQESGM